MSVLTDLLLGAEGLIPWAFIGAGKLRTPAERPATTKPPRAEVAADSTPVTPAPVHPVTPAAKKGVPRSTKNPGLAAFAASRDHDPVTGQFLPVNGPS